jgi:hypothetical protein
MVKIDGKDEIADGLASTLEGWGILQEDNEIRYRPTGTQNVTRNKKPEQVWASPPPPFSLRNCTAGIAVRQWVGCTCTTREKRRND